MRKAIILVLGFMSIYSCVDQKGYDSAISNDNLKAVLADDQQLNAAIEKAKLSFIQFDTAFKSGNYDTALFSLKVRIETKVGAEHFWTNGISYEDSSYYGYIDEDPVSAIHIKRGDKIKITKDNLSDWMYADNGVLMGGFTIRAFRDRMSADERKSFDSALRLKIID